MERLLNYAKELRTNTTEAEDSLWYYLRAKRLNGYKFKRQQPIGRYIVDFVCLEKKLIIELDGSQHLSNEQYDQQRDRWFSSEGYKVLRINNVEFFENRDAVLELIAKSCAEFHPLPDPLPSRERGKCGE